MPSHISIPDRNPDHFIVMHAAILYVIIVLFGLSVFGNLAQWAGRENIINTGLKNHVMHYDPVSGELVIDQMPSAQVQPSTQ